MKTIILYGSTYGYAEDCATKLSEKLDGEVKLVNLMKGSAPELKEFDKVIIGGSIYIGNIQKKIKNYCISNLEELLNKKVGLFICCGLMENIDLNMKNSFSEKLLDKAVKKECFGGELRVEKMKFMHKFMTGIMTKATIKSGKELPKPLPENIENFAQAMNAYAFQK